MTITVKCFVRDIYWKDMIVQEGTQYVNFALLSSTGDIRTVRSQIYHSHPWEDYTAIIEDEEIAIYDRDTLCETHRSHMYSAPDAYQPESNDKLNRYEILDLKEK